MVIVSLWSDGGKKSSFLNEHLGGCWRMMRVFRRSVLDWPPHLLDFELVCFWSVSGLFSGEIFKKGRSNYKWMLEEINKIKYDLHSLKKKASKWEQWKNEGMASGREGKMVLLGENTSTIGSRFSFRLLVCKSFKLLLLAYKKKKKAYFK